MGRERHRQCGRLDTLAGGHNSINELQCLKWKRFAGAVPVFVTTEIPVATNISLAHLLNMRFDRFPLLFGLPGSIRIIAMRQSLEV